jgi:hypothetical protein
VLGEEVFSHRVALLTEIIRLLLTMVPEQRSHVVSEDAAEYGSEKWKIAEIPFCNS